ncbi:MAG: hypothetical protein H6736_00500 [Alphaproteobacteria bacterium]|nr:hypothetical protein [Alphaproteobacteria bacterium]
MLVPGPADMWSIIADDVDGLLTLVPVMGTSTLGTLTRPAFSPDGAWAIVEGRWVDTSVPTAVASVPTGSDADAIFAAAAAVAVVRYLGPAGSNGQVVAWDGTDLVTRMTLPVPGGADALSADGRWLARSDTAGVSVYDTLSGLLVPGPYATGDQTARIRFTGERALVVAPGFETVVSVLDPVGATSLQIGSGLDAALGVARVVVAHADGPVTWHDLAGPTGTVPGTSDSSWAAPAGPLLAVQDVEGLKLVDPDSSAVVATWAGVWHPGAHLADGSRMLMGEPSGEVRVLPDGGWERIETDLASVRFADGLHGVYTNPNVRIATYSPEGALLTELEHPGATLEPLFRDTWLGSARGAPCALFIGLDDTVCAR